MSAAPRDVDAGDDAPPEGGHLQPAQGSAAARDSTSTPIRIDLPTLRKLAPGAAGRALGQGDGSKVTEVIWSEGGDELSVDPAKVDVKTTDGAILFSIPVRCDQSGQGVADIGLAVGSPRSGAPACSRRRRGGRTGHSAVVERWADALVALAWGTLVELANSISSVAGRDQDGDELIPGEHRRRRCRPARRPVRPASSRSAPEMTLTASDLGVLGDLATALGIVKDGAADPTWFGDPAARLGTVLADDDQRQALVSFLDTVLDDGSVETDDQGRVRLPIVTHDDPDLTVAVVLEPKESTVVVSLGVELRTSPTTGAQARPATESRLDIALLQAARGNAPAPDPVLLLGARGGRIRLSSTVVHRRCTRRARRLPPRVDRRVGRRADVERRRRPGDRPEARCPPAAGRDGRATSTSASAASTSWTTSLLDLVLGLVRAQAASASGAFQALATLLGLGASATIPPLPVEQLATTGVRAITAWLDGVLADATSRAAWFAELAPG